MTHQERYMWCYTWRPFPKLSMSFNSHPADRLHPCANTIHTHRHDPLHCLQLQGVLVAIQHLLQVIMSMRERGGKKPTEKLALNFPVCPPCWAAPPDYWGLKREKQTCFLRSKFIKVCKPDPEIIPFEVRNPTGKIWEALKVELMKTR